MTQNPHFQIGLGLRDELTPGLRQAEQQVEQSRRRMAMGNAVPSAQTGGLSAMNALMGRPGTQTRGPGSLPPVAGIAPTGNALDALMGRGAARQIEAHRPVGLLEQRQQQRMAEEEEMAGRVRTVRKTLIDELARFGIELSRINKERLRIEQERIQQELHIKAMAQQRVERYGAQADELAAEAMAASAGGISPGDTMRRPAGAAQPSPDRDAWFRRGVAEPGFISGYLGGDRTERMRERERQPELERYLVERQRISQQLQDIARNEGRAIIDDLREQERMLSDMMTTAPGNQAVEEMHKTAQTRLSDFEKVNSGLERMAASGEVADRYLENTTSRVINLGMAADSEEMLRYADSLHIVGNEYRTIGNRWQQAQRSGMFLTDMTKNVQQGFQGVASSAQGMMLGMSALEGNIIGLTFSLIFLQFAGLGGLALAAAGATLAIGGTIKGVQSLIEKRQEERRAAAGLGLETLDPDIRERERQAGEQVFRQQFLPGLSADPTVTPRMMHELERDFEKAYSNMMARFLLTPELAVIGERRPDLLFQYRQQAGQDLFSRLLSRQTAGEDVTEQGLRDLADLVAQNVVTLHRTGRGLYPREEGVFVTPDTLAGQVVPAAMRERQRTRDEVLFGAALTPDRPSYWGGWYPGMPAEAGRRGAIEDEAVRSPWMAYGDRFGAGGQGDTYNVYVSGNNIRTQDDAESIGDTIIRKLKGVGAFPAFGYR